MCTRLRKNKLSPYNYIFAGLCPYIMHTIISKISALGRENTSSSKESCTRDHSLLLTLFNSLHNDYATATRVCTQSSRTLQIRKMHYDKTVASTPHKLADCLRPGLMQHTVCIASYVLMNQQPWKVMAAVATDHQ